MQMTAEGGLRLFLLGPDHGIEATLALTDVGVTPEEIHRAGPEAKHLRQPRVVIVILRHVAIGAILRRPLSTGRVRKMRIESLATVTLGTDGLLLGINPFAVG